MSRVLVTGGAGYIGSHTVLALAEEGHEVVVYDSLEEGHAEAVKGFPLVRADVHDSLHLAGALREHRIEAVIHFAAYLKVPESMEKPGKYFYNNTAGTLNLLQQMVQEGVEHLVFSSTCAVYGEPERTPITEDHPKDPTNPYGLSKWMSEEMMDWFGRIHGLQSIRLRYFNAAGADPKGRVGEDHRPEIHLIPLVLEVALGKRPEIMIFGDDYDTPDGTCIRDYIHVTDLAQAHLLALKALQGGAKTKAYNAGNGKGFSVKEVIEAAREVTGHPIPATIKGRRAGDPARLIGSADRLRHELGWNPQYADLKTILRTAWDWYKAHPNGYG
ncbi:MAG TPA: UDP-glucose 4-epimerase GalE [Armatimonadota bacterium]|nr:UDP-glucose 4-epimerase GalE [Armatimonadota bacterium]